MSLRLPALNRSKPAVRPVRQVILVSQVHRPSTVKLVGPPPIQLAHRPPPLAAPAILATMRGSSAVMTLAEGPSDCRPSARSLNSRGRAP
jgi:hypothetical protein